MGFYFLILGLFMSLGVSGVVYFSRIKNGIMYLDGGASDYKFGRRVNILLKEAQGEAAESSDNCDNTTV